MQQKESILIELLRRKGEEVKMGKFKSREKMLAKVIKSGCYKLEEKENEANRKLGEEDDASTIMEDAWEREKEEAPSRGEGEGEGEEEARERKIDKF